MALALWSCGGIYLFDSGCKNVRGTAIKVKPKRIVAAAPNLTEILFALGLDDNVVEGDETFTVTLSNPSANATITDTTATGTITNEDYPKPVLMRGQEENETLRKGSNTARGVYSRIEGIIMKQSTKHAIREWVESIVIAVILALFIRAFFIQAFKIPSGSMRPTLQEGDKIMVNKLLFGPKVPFTDYRFPGLREPERGDIIVFVYPEDTKKDFIKRLVAVGGETIEISNGNILIGGEAIEAPPEISKIYYYNRGGYGREGRTAVQ